MLPDFNPTLLLATKPKNLKEFAAMVLYSDLPLQSVVGEWYEAAGLGPKAWYVGSAEQNMKLLRELYAHAKLSPAPK